ncbi:VOC family protein [Mycolicibacterium sphagni]|uniref:Glyoxalase n=1 Tax=Mycolicibacterium sphagni TaxID=1786 RepID=A0A255DJW4_9MYCO|nr:VOC family protein [Mycolicibacterium sphagni]MCV7178646.1 VOC family protein [Mycolicibacterium sphagni]OYN75933.1 glyoxalase [Mycolicibacterium sphagni]
MSRNFGNIAQIGYVVRDIDAAMDDWVKHGVGPWFYVDRVQTDYFRYRGVESDMQMSVALANSGDVQLELIQPRNDAPSMYKDFLESGREGMQHIAYWSSDYQSLLDRALRDGYTIGQEGSIGGEKGRFAYLDTETTQGTVIEISDISGPKGQFFQYIREVAATWDGTDPIRGRE